MNLVVCANPSSSSWVWVVNVFFMVPSHPGSPGQRVVKRLCVCVCSVLHYTIQSVIVHIFDKMFVKVWWHSNMLSLCLSWGTCIRFKLMLTPSSLLSIPYPYQLSTQPSHSFLCPAIHRVLSMLEKSLKMLEFGIKSSTPLKVLENR